MHTSTWLAIFVGGALGALAAVAMDSPKAPPPPKLAPVAALPTEAAPAPVSPERDTAPPTVASNEPAKAPSPEARRPAATSESSPVHTSAGSGAAASTIKSREDLARAEVACQEKREARACREAALAYEQGAVVPADAAKARLFRKIDLTFLVKQCEGQVPSACLDLAARYERGDGVAANQRNAEALRARAKELCAGRGGVGCPKP